MLDEGTPDGLEDGSLTDLLDGLAAPGYLAIMGYLPYDDAVDAAVSRAARGGDRASTASPPPGATARASCTRRASSTRAARPPGASSSSCTTRTDDLEVPGKPYSFRTLIDAQADGDLQTLRVHGLPAARVRLPAGDLAGAITRILKASSKTMQLGFVGLGKMGGNMVHRIRRDSDHEVVAFDFNADALQAAEGHGATPAHHRSRTSSQKLETPRMVWLMVPSGDPTQQTIDTLAGAARGGRHDRRRRQHELARRRAPRGDARRRRASTTSTSATSGGVWGLEVGYCMMVGGHEESGPAARADPRRARPARRLAPLRRRGRRATS